MVIVGDGDSNWHVAPAHIFLGSGALARRFAGGAYGAAMQLRTWRRGERGRAIFGHGAQGHGR